MANYHALIENKVYIGGENALLEALKENEITDVFDLRDNGTEAEGFPTEVTRHHFPIVEDEAGQGSYVKAAIQAVTDAVNSGKTVYFHCAGGRNRTGTVATGVLLELEMASTVEEAEALAKEKRPDINIKQEMRDVLRGFYVSRK
ncbi:protein phosphatase [Paenibacillus sp. VTT E-133280]|uniref:protein-tyrosine phosphatase family protein n=1 Tax=unclassified Paenibacillus TaxID=185978 RepID=UPI000BA001AA|nr:MULTISPECIES: dual specificity protein phosphatase family protein [unclassified Paenibacillus]MBY3621333.1 protein phosphatase [Acinetobacter sp. CUI P1]MDH6373064.1 protein-tyrosine phosphatase [Paenibacillus sp. PastF-3]OZQ62267.1 protein phosphatase [Paenibacillus sp. VTT E-133280]OZQ80919.1 protein phosphatase [Paenibacillus sp. VTT E-133291]